MPTSTTDSKHLHALLHEPDVVHSKRLLLDRDFAGDLSPEACIADGYHSLLGVTVYVHVQHEPAKRGTQVIW